MAIKLNMTPFCLSDLLTAEKLLIREFTAFLSVTFAQNVVLFSWSMKIWTSTGNPLEIKLFLCCPNYNTLTSPRLRQRCGNRNIRWQRRSRMRRCIVSGYCAIICIFWKTGRCSAHPKHRTISGLPPKPSKAVSVGKGRAAK